MVGFKKHSKVAQSLILGITLRSFKDVISSCPSKIFFFVDRPPLLVVKQGSHKLGGRHSRRKQRRASEALFGK